MSREQFLYSMIPEEILGNFNWRPYMLTSKVNSVQKVNSLSSSVYFSHRVNFACHTRALSGHFDRKWLADGKCAVDAASAKFQSTRKLAFQK